MGTERAPKVLVKKHLENVPHKDTAEENSGNRAVRGGGPNNIPIITQVVAQAGEPAS